MHQHLVSSGNGPMRITQRAAAFYPEITPVVVFDLSHREFPPHRYCCKEDLWRAFASQSACCPSTEPVPNSSRPMAETPKPRRNGQGNSQGEIWSGKRGSNSRPIPWQGIALPTELFPQGDHRGDQRKTHRRDGQFNLVAWGGIEPPTQGFSILCSTD